MQATAGLASRWIFWFRTIAAIGVRPRWSRSETKGLHHECQPRLRCIRRARPSVRSRSRAWTDSSRPHHARNLSERLRTCGAAPEQSRCRSFVDVYRVSLDACGACAPIAAALSANLRDQLLRASSSAVLNTAEGFGSASRGVKRRHYEIARGSAMECVAILDLVVALGLQDDVAGARALLTRAAMMLSKLEARFR
jgi:four helix bundle protein